MTTNIIKSERHYDLGYQDAMKDVASLKVTTFAAHEPGPRLIITGAVHGNEKAGTKAIHTIQEGIESGEIPIAKGTVELVPIVNPLAYFLDVRGVAGIDGIVDDWNRSVCEVTNPRTYGERGRNAVCDIMRRAHHEATIQCQPVFNLTLHTYSG